MGTSWVFWVAVAVTQGGDGEAVAADPVTAAYQRFQNAEESTRQAIVAEVVKSSRSPMTRASRTC